jgi:hypothetical protein
MGFERLVHENLTGRSAKTAGVTGLKEVAAQDYAHVAERVSVAREIRCCAMLTTVPISAVYILVQKPALGRSFKS